MQENWKYLFFYDGEEIGTRRVEMVELKAIISIEDVHLAQGLNYLVAYKLDKGLLINFGSKSLEVKRLRHPKNKMPNTIPGGQSNNVINKSDSE